MEKTIEELQSEIATLTTAKEALTGELTDTRPKIREANEKIALLTEQLAESVRKNDANPEEEKIKALVSGILQQEKQGKTVSNRKAAFDKFVSENKEYHPDNDPGGIKRAALETEFNSFNTSDMSEIEDFTRVIGKANTYLRGTDTQRQTQGTPGSSSSSTPPNPTHRDESGLSEREQKLIERNGWTKEKYLNLKAKMPGMIDDLIAGVAH